jgi:hypothetical protein
MSTESQNHCKEKKAKHQTDPFENTEYEKFETLQKDVWRHVQKKLKHTQCLSVHQEKRVDLHFVLTPAQLKSLL